MLFLVAIVELFSAGALISCHYIRNYYSPGPANLYWGNQYLGVKQLEVVLDTGSTFTYFGLQSYQAFLSAVNINCLRIEPCSFPL